jgi:hypothetical protein
MALYSRGKSPRYPLDRRAGWAPDPAWTTWRREISWPYQDSNFYSSVIHPVASRYTDYAIPAPVAKQRVCNRLATIEVLLDAVFHTLSVSYQILIRGKVVPVLNLLSAMSWRHTWEWRYSATFLDLGTRWRWVVSFTPLLLYPRGKSPNARWIGGWVGTRVGVDAQKRNQILIM